MELWRWSEQISTTLFNRSYKNMTIVSIYEVTSTSLIATSNACSPRRWRMPSHRNCKPSRIRSSRRFGFQQGSESGASNLHTASLWKRRRPCSSRDISGRIQRGSTGVDSRIRSSDPPWQVSIFGGVDILVNSSLMVTNVQANMALIALAAALGSLVLAIPVLLGLSILCHPLWIVRWAQKRQPHVFYLKATQEKIVALTLDDGPHAHITPQLLDILKENDCKATWFLIGNHMEPCPDVVERIHAEGHEVANHTMEDVASWTLSKNEFEAQLVECEDRIKTFFRYNSSGQALKWFRPGHGFYNQQIIKTCKEHGYRVALGSLYPMDHMFTKQGKLLAKNLLWRIHPGAVIILHDRVPQYAQTPEMLRLLLPELKTRGYKIVTLSELDQSRSDAETKKRSD